jgi:protein SCO1
MPDVIPITKPSVQGNHTPAGLLASVALANVPAKPARIVLDWEQYSSHELIVRQCFPNVVLTSHEGKRVQLYDDLVKDKIVLMNFMYASCQQTCPQVTKNLLKVQRLFGPRMGRDVFMYSFTLDPTRDTCSVLAQYAARHGVGRGWYFLTGATQDLDLLRRKLGFTNLDPVLDQDKNSHVGNVRYGNESRQLWSACPGLSQPEFIFKAISWVDWPSIDYRG